MELQRLANVPLLSSLTDDQLETAHGELDHLVVEPGTVLVRQGEPSPGLFLVLSGEVAVVREVDGRERDMAVLGPNAFFGEMSFQQDDDDDAPGAATATVRARIPTSLAVLPRERADLLDRLPDLRDRLAEVAQRRRASNQVAEMQPITVDTGRATVRLRPLWPDDWRLMDAARGRASDESLRRRFFSMPNLTEYTMRRLANVDWEDHFAWAALADVDADGIDDLSAVGRYARLTEEPTAAELAFLVTDDLQGKGVGTLLAGALAVAAARHGIETFTATALAENVAVHALLEKFGARWGPGDRAQEVAARWPVRTALAATDPDLASRLGPMVDAVIRAADRA